MAQQQQQSGNNDNSMGPVWIVALLFFALYIVWATAHRFIVSFIFLLNVWQAKLISFFINSPQLAKDTYIMQTVDPTAVTWEQLMLLTRSVGEYMRYPVIVIFIILAIILYRSNVTLRFRRTHDMKTLRAQEQHNWPAIMPVIKQDLVSIDINEGPWAMALTPMEFAKKYNLLRKEDAILDNPEPGMEFTAGIRRGDAKRVFTLQLGPYWDGFDKCSPQAAALAAVFMARMNRDRAAASMILETLDKTASEGKPDFTVAKSVLQKYQNTEAVQEIVQSHAYMLCVLAGLLSGARDDGVVPSAEFLWLKPYDRRLWYMLNGIGRQTPFAEVAGPFAHWKAEKAMGRRSLVPMIDEAIKALETAVKEVKLTPRQLRELQL